MTTKTTKTTNTIAIGFPERYSDPRDFHEFVIKTYLESRKLKKPKSTKALRPKLLYLPVRQDMLGARYSVLALGYLLHSGYDKICFFIADYTLPLGTIHQASRSTLQSEFQQIAVTPLFPSDKKTYVLPLDDINAAYGHVFSAVGCMSMIQSISVATLGLGEDELPQVTVQLIQDRMMHSRCVDDDSCCVFIGDFAGEQEHPVVGTYFELFAKMLKRKPRSVEFATDVGNMLVQVA
ncbi:MAG: hypothetical protein WC004_01395 [Candidatus Absconditabacterales bacterium]